MRHVLIKIDICYSIVLDDDTPLKEIFIAMSQVLNLNYDIFAKLNHKGLTVDNSYRFSNESVTIAFEVRDSNDTFAPTGIVTGRAWDQTPIDGTDRELHFFRYKS